MNLKVLNIGTENTQLANGSIFYDVPKLADGEKKFDAIPKQYFEQRIIAAITKLRERIIIATSTHDHTKREPLLKATKEFHDRLMAVIDSLVGATGIQSDNDLKVVCEELNKVIEDYKGKKSGDVNIKRKSTIVHGILTAEREAMKNIFDLPETNPKDAEGKSPSLVEQVKLLQEQDRNLQETNEMVKLLSDRIQKETPACKQAFECLRNNSNAIKSMVSRHPDIASLNSVMEEARTGYQMAYKAVIANVAKIGEMAELFDHLESLVTPYLPEETNWIKEMRNAYEALVGINPTFNQKITELDAASKSFGSNAKAVNDFRKKVIETIGDTELQEAIEKIINMISCNGNAEKIRKLMQENRQEEEDNEADEVAEPEVTEKDKPILATATKKEKKVFGRMNWDGTSEQRAERIKERLVNGFPIISYLEERGMWNDLKKFLSFLSLKDLNDNGISNNLYVYYPKTEGKSQIAVMLEDVFPQAYSAPQQTPEPKSEKAERTQWSTISDTDARNIILEKIGRKWPLMITLAQENQWDLLRSIIDRVNTLQTNLELSTSCVSAEFGRFKTKEEMFKVVFPQAYTPEEIDKISKEPEQIKS